MAAKWEQIGAFLGLPPSLIASIRGNHPSDNTGCWNDALLQWVQQKYNIQKFGEPSWKSLLKAVAKVDKLQFKKLATDHQGKYCNLYHVANYDNDCFLKFVTVHKRTRNSKSLMIAKSNRRVSYHYFSFLVQR